ncbi:MAG: sigma-70 family RNA polymerase sigma factor [Proteobacteria bacterium]|nr:sigma-70 family RNA polymerase sigma factor [Pseudomonadota bacterium]
MGMTSSDLFDRFDGARRTVPGALDAFLRQSAGLLEAWCRRWQAALLVRTHLVEDVVQDALFHVWQHFRTCRADSTPELVAWLHAIARHAAVDSLRLNHPEHRVQIRVVSLDVILSNRGAWGDEEDSADERSSALVADVLAMLDRTSDPAIRELLWRRLVGEESWEEIGSALGISWTAARRRFQRAMRRARVYLTAAVVTGTTSCDAARGARRRFE